MLSYGHAMALAAHSYVDFQHRVDNHRACRHEGVPVDMSMRCGCAYRMQQRAAAPTDMHCCFAQLAVFHA